MSYLESWRQNSSSISKSAIENLLFSLNIARTPIEVPLYAKGQPAKDLEFSFLAHYGNLIRGPWLYHLTPMPFLILLLNHLDRIYPDSGKFTIYVLRFYSIELHDNHFLSFSTNQHADIFCSTMLQQILYIAWSLSFRLSYFFTDFRIS